MKFVRSAQLNAFLLVLIVYSIIYLFAYEKKNLGILGSFMHHRKSTEYIECAHHFSIDASNSDRRGSTHGSGTISGFLLLQHNHAKCQNTCRSLHGQKVFETQRSKKWLGTRTSRMAITLDTKKSPNTSPLRPSSEDPTGSNTLQIKDPTP
jgi:hypothetical protein